MEHIGKLRDINPDELELMLAWRNAPTVRFNMYTCHEISLDEHLAWWATTQQRKDQQYFMYEYRGEPAGIVAFNGIDPVNKNTSYALYASPFAPKGCGARMDYLALEHAFGPLGAHKLHCEVLGFNTAVIKLHMKFGFQVEGVFRQHYRRDDNYIDIYRLAILASEWSAQRPAMQEKLARVA